ncbi:MAG: hypothetical protein HYY06_17375 [Deltaproteobacteria bacterium]|nr:hypothetical protein [Deltaproteobacteria bacterium]
MAKYLRNLLRPWKVVTFLLGTAFFVWGALYWDLATWDVGVSFLMSILCFLFAPWAVEFGLDSVRRRPRRWGLRLLAAAAVVYMIGSGSYEIYNTLRMGHHPITYWENLFFSVPVTVMAGLVWRWDGSIADFVRELRRALRDTERRSS